VRANRLHIGIGVDQNLPWPTLIERWRLIEALGFDSIWDFDHFNQPSRPDGPYLEAWTLLAGIATHTSRVRIGVLVSSNTFRHPALLAKQAVTLDHMSGGRLEVGIGAGWFVPEHDAFGLYFPPPGERVSRFREAVEIVDRLLRQERFKHQNAVPVLVAVTDGLPTVPLRLGGDPLADVVAEGRALRRAKVACIVVDASRPGAAQASCGHELARASGGVRLPLTELAPDLFDELDVML